VAEQVGRGQLGPKSELQGRGNPLFGHRGHHVPAHHVPAHHVLADHILLGTEVGPVTVSQRQVGEVADPYLARLGRLGLVEQPIGRATQSMR